MPYCRKCGSLTKENANFCSRCGYTLKPQNRNELTEIPKQEGNIEIEVKKGIDDGTTTTGYRKQESISLWSYYLLCWKKFFILKGRACRKEYWGFSLFHGLPLIVFIYLEYSTPNIRWLHLIYFRIALIPLIAVGVRRLHDLGRSGWYEVGYHIFFLILSASTLLNPDVTYSDMIEYICGVRGCYIGKLLSKNPLNWAGNIYMCVLKLYFIKKGNSGNNQYGEDPLEK